MSRRLASKGAASHGFDLRPGIILISKVPKPKYRKVTVLAQFLNSDIKTAQKSHNVAITEWILKSDIKNIFISNAIIT
jgi:hypothetical protein